MKALRITDSDGAQRVEMNTADLSAGSVLIEVRYSGINYKDALAVTGRGKVVRKPPLNAGIDAAGVVELSDDPALAPGDPVIVTGWSLSETRDGGFADYVRVPAGCVTACPEELSLWQTMALGTAGLTAAMAIERLTDNGQQPADGPVAVTGATGGVGLLAIDMLAAAGYTVHAVTRRGAAHGDWLRELGAAEIIAPEALVTNGKPLAAASLAGGIDTLGGAPLANLFAHVGAEGNVAVVGLAAGVELNTTVLPLILRGAALLGVNSVDCPAERRARLWSQMATSARPAHLPQIAAQTVGIDAVPQACETLLAGEHVGRTVVDVRA